jgi:uncharacterized protein YndB with AHSA1/START domain
MSLFVDESVEIGASASSVWEMLTRRGSTSKWAPEFTGGAPFRIESGWQIGDAVSWITADDQILVGGVVTAARPFTLLRFTVVPTGAPDPGLESEDGIRYDLSQRGGATTLRVRQGDFGTIDGGQGFYEQTVATWQRVLPILKQLAEGSPR